MSSSNGNSSAVSNNCRPCEQHAECTLWNIHQVEQCRCSWSPLWILRFIWNGLSSDQHPEQIQHWTVLFLLHWRLTGRHEILLQDHCFCKFTRIFGTFYPL